MNLEKCTSEFLKLDGEKTIIFAKLQKARYELKYASDKKEAQKKIDELTERQKDIIDRMNELVKLGYRLCKK